MIKKQAIIKVLNSPNLMMIELTIDILLKNKVRKKNNIINVQRIHNGKTKSLIIIARSILRLQRGILPN